MSYMAYHALEDSNEFNPCVGVGASCILLLLLEAHCQRLLEICCRRGGLSSFEWNKIMRWYRYKALRQRQIGRKEEDADANAE